MRERGEIKPAADGTAARKADRAAPRMAAEGPDEVGLVLFPVRLLLLPRALQGLLDDRILQQRSACAVIDAIDNGAAVVGRGYVVTAGRQCIRRVRGRID